MSNKDLSVVFPSRERLPLLFDCLSSIAENTTDLTRIEVLVAIDSDDKKTVQAAPSLEQQFPFVKFFVGERKNNLSEGYYSPLAIHSTGGWVQLFNDDAQMVTKGWNVAALEVLNSFQEEHPDGILLGCPHDDTGCAYSCFPVLSRQAILALGHAINPAFGSWGGDVQLDMVFTTLGRKVPLQYSISHKCPHNRTRGRDRVQARMPRLTRGYPYQETVKKDVERLRKIIGESTR